jgi:ribonuclease R
LFRVHEVPGEEKVTALREFLNSMGRSLGGKAKPTPEDYQRLLSDLKGSAEQELVQTVMLRSMKQAVYSPENKGHFGLAYSSYAHFTSPIRRYPDLLLHRALRYLIRSRVESAHVERVKGAERLPKAQHLPYGDKEMVELGMLLSDAERRADGATRDVDDWLKCEYMLDRVGETYEGIISAVTGFGFFVQLTDVYVEGLVHISNLENDYYHFNAANHSLEGEHSGRRFRLADPVTVRVAAVNLDDRKIDFELEGSSSNKEQKRPSRRSKPSGEGRKPSRSKENTEKTAAKGQKKNPKSSPKKAAPGSAKKGGLASKPRKKPARKPRASAPGGAKTESTAKTTSTSKTSKKSPRR